MEVEYEITETDYVNSVRLAAVASRKQAIRLVVWGIGLLLLGVFGSDSFQWMAYCGLVGGIIGYFATLYLLTPWQAKRHYRNYKSIHKPLSLEMLEDGFVIKTETGLNHVKWENTLKWREDKSYILVFLAPKLFNMIPKRLASSGLDIEGFRKQLREKLGAPEVPRTALH